MFDKEIEYARFIQVVTEKQGNDIAYARLVGILATALNFGWSVDETNAHIEKFAQELEG